MAIYERINGIPTLIVGDGTKADQLKALEAKLKAENKEIPSCFDALVTETKINPVIENAIPEPEKVETWTEL